MDGVASVAGALAAVGLIAVLCLSFVLAPGLIANRILDRKCADVAVKHSPSDEGIVSFVKEVLNSAADPITWSVSVAVWGALAFLVWKIRSKWTRPAPGFEELQSVLSKCGLAGHFKKFQEHNITDVLLPLLTDEQLQSIGIAKVGDRMRLLEEFSVK